MADAARIYVVCPDKMCFYVDAVTLDPLGRASYDPYWNAPYAPQPQMGVNEWSLKHVPMMMEREMACRIVKQDIDHRNHVVVRCNCGARWEFEYPGLSIRAEILAHFDAAKSRSPAPATSL